MENAASVSTAPFPAGRASSSKAEPASGAVAGAVAVVQNAAPIPSSKLTDADLVANPTWHIVCPTLNCSYATSNAVQAYVAATSYEVLAEIPASFSPPARTENARPPVPGGADIKNLGSGSGGSNSLDAILQQHLSHVVWMPLRVPGYIGADRLNTARYFAVNVLRVQEGIEDSSTATASRKVHLGSSTANAGSAAQAVEEHKTAERSAFIEELLSGKFPSMLLGKDFWARKKEKQLAVGDIKVASSPSTNWNQPAANTNRERSSQRPPLGFEPPPPPPATSKNMNEKGGKTLPVHVLGRDEKINVVCSVDGTDGKDDEISLSCIEINGVNGPHVLPGVGGTYRWKQRPPDYDEGEEIALEVDYGDKDMHDQDEGPGERVVVDEYQVEIDSEDDGDSKSAAEDDGDDETSEDSADQVTRGEQEMEDPVNIHVVEERSRHRPLPPFALLLVADLHPFPRLNVSNLPIPWDEVYGRKGDSLVPLPSTDSSSRTTDSMLASKMAAVDLGEDVLAQNLLDATPSANPRVKPKAKAERSKTNSAATKGKGVALSEDSRRLVFDSLEAGICVLEAAQHSALCTTRATLMPNWARKERAKSVEEVLGDASFWYFDLSLGNWKSASWSEVCGLRLKAGSRSTRQGGCSPENSSPSAMKNRLPSSSTKTSVESEIHDQTKSLNDSTRNKPKMKALKLPGKWAKYLQD